MNYICRMFNLPQCPVILCFYNPLTPKDCLIVCGFHCLSCCYAPSLFSRISSPGVHFGKQKKKKDCRKEIAGVGWISQVLEGLFPRKPPHDTWGYCQPTIHHNYRTSPSEAQSSRGFPCIRQLWNWRKGLSPPAGGHKYICVQP